MSKQKKKRNKPYQGADAAAKTPTVRRYKAVPKGPIAEWWQTRKAIVRPISIIVGLTALISWFIFEALRWIF